MLERIKKRLTPSRYPDDFVISASQFYSLFLYSDLQLAEEYVADTELSGQAMHELVRRYGHYDITAPLFANPADLATANIHIGEVS